MNINSNKDLENCSSKTPYFSLNGIKCLAKVITVKDGDTLVLATKISNSFYKFNVRLANIDTCEIKSKNQKIKQLGLTAKYRVIDLFCKTKNVKINFNLDSMTKKEIQDIFEKNCFIAWIECYEFDKYGRVLADVYVKKDDESISNILLKEKLAYKYTGATKLTEEEQLELLL